MNLYVDWECPSCGKEARVGAEYGQVVHQCPKLGGLTTPYVRKGVKAKHELVMRQDYANGDLIPRDDQGRAVMAINTIRDNGQDATVFASTIVVKGQVNG